MVEQKAFRWFVEKSSWSRGLLYKPGGSLRSSSGRTWRSSKHNARANNDEVSWVPTSGRNTDRSAVVREIYHTSLTSCVRLSRGYLRRELSSCTFNDRDPCTTGYCRYRFLAKSTKFGATEARTTKRIGDNHTHNKTSNDWNDVNNEVYEKQNGTPPPISARRRALPRGQREYFGQCGQRDGA